MLDVFTKHLPRLLRASGIHRYNPLIGGMMDSDGKTAALRIAFDVMQQQMQSVHREWIAEIANLYPHLADVLWKYHEQYCTGHLHAGVLPLVLRLNPDLSLHDLLHMYALAFEGSATGDVRQVPELETEVANLDRYKRSGRTKRLRSREALISAAVQTIMKGGVFSMEDIAAAAAMSLDTAYAHFGSRDGLLKAACVRLTAQFFAPTKDQ